MSTRPSSLDAAAQEVFDSEAERGAVFGAPSAAGQLDMLRDERGNLPKNVFQLVRADEAARRGPGRPKGSRNKVSKDLARLIQHKFGDPVEYLAGLYAMPLDQLIELLKLADGGKAAKTGDVAIKALNIQLAAAKSVAEYVHSKKPVEVSVDHQNLPVLVMPGAGGGAAQAGDMARAAADGLAELLKSGRIAPADIVGLQLVDGQLQRVEDGEFVEVDLSADFDDDEVES